MLFEETPRLEKFVLNYLQRVGALTEQESYATLADRERREKDATERYGVEVDIRLDHVVAYYIPCLWVKLELAHKDQVRAFTVLYNPLSNEIEMPVCECCGRQTTSLVPDQDGFVCPVCSVGGRENESKEF